MLNGCAVVTNEHVHDTVEATHDHAVMAIAPKYRSVAVLPFFNETGSATADMYARHSFASKLVAHKNYTVLPLKETDAILARLPRSAVDLKEYKTLGENLHADLLAFGWALEQTHSFGFVYNRNAIRARVALVDAQTGKVVFDAEDTRSRLLIGFSLITMIEDEYMWAREVNNRYDELFRDMMPELPDRILK
jgi:TolB-like protein